jgi:hypothetical protein
MEDLAWKLTTEGSATEAAILRARVGEGCIFAFDQKRVLFEPV